MKVFQEQLAGHFGQALTVDEVLHRSRTRFQEVLVFRNRVFGKVLALDGVIQTTELDNQIYHEMIAHLPLVAHGAAERVLVVGGGDGGVLKEILKHPVSEVVLAELDGEVIDLCREFLPEVSGGSFDDARVTVVLGDASEYVDEARAAFDVIVVDSTDPVGPGERLFDERFYARCKALLKPDGIVAVQSGTAFFQGVELEILRARLERAFGAARPYLAPVPTYAGGMLALIAATSTEARLRPPPEVLRARLAAIGAQTRYYSPDVHAAAFGLAPAFDRAPARTA
ncbi:polyamine aminopropyltransferase [Enterovirga rhinocerotis]|uniref:Polyamine aminopropyltransferase n=1 Tax=Enterovirga rhinocerotis TaxID=1339210 RepID=A0A4R7C0Q6_9HYPH|nr:polyamine aminopropyltransferase [Enterovirga rhinocerotis]TDR89956.1 spermidine synthase [Enterovirga rhinocerotis]